MTLSIGAQKGGGWGGGEGRKAPDRIQQLFVTETRNEGEFPQPGKGDL